MKQIIAAAAALLFLCGNVQAQHQPTLSLDFEEVVEGSGVDNKVVSPRVEGKTELVEGKFGKAFKSGPTTGYLHFPTTGIVNTTEGTVEMWVSPVEWSGTEERFHVFFDARGDGALYLYKFFNGGLLFLTAADQAGPFRNAAYAIEKWQPGSWHHIAATWSPARQALYVDGRLAATAAPLLPTRLDPEFLLGDHPWSEDVGKRTSHSLIDRVRIYDRELTAQHIAAHFAGDYDRVVPLTPELASLRSFVDSEKRLLLTEVDTGGADSAKPVEAKVELIQGDKVLGANDLRLRYSTAQTKFSLAELTPGDYQLRATLNDGVGQPVVLTKPIVLTAANLSGRSPSDTPKIDLKETPWSGNQLGLGPGVPAPWTPLKVQRQGPTFAVACWGRTYTFGNAPLPVQITSRNQPLLAQPIALNLKANGKTLVWTNGRAQIKQATSEAVEIAGQAEARTAAGRVLLTTKLVLEYDGVAVIDLQLKAPPATKLETMWLDIPVKAAHAMYQHRWTPAWEGYSGSIPAALGVVDHSAFTPFAWLGDNDRGLFWFCEKGEFWPNWQSKHACETIRTAGAVSMRFNLLAAGQKLPGNWKYQFGLQATPVKPIARDWRKWRYQIDGPLPGATVQLLWPTGKPDAHKWFGYPEAADPKAFAARVQSEQGRGLKVTPYTTLTQMWAETPEWQSFRRQWNLNRPSEKSIVVGINNTPQFEWALPTSKSYSDWLIWKHVQFMKQYKFDGYYIDQAHPYSTTREEGGAWQDAKGNWQSVYPILAYRDLYRRFYRAIKQANPNAYIIVHMSGKMGIPYVAYSDAYIDGEHFRGQFLDKDSYMDVLPLDAVRAEYMGRQWGSAPVFIPELFNEDATPADRAKIEPSRGLVALLMLHDISWLEIWMNPQPSQEAIKALQSFGYVDADFIPYFDPKPPAATAMRDVYTSVYKRKDGRALAIVANLSKEDRSGTVQLDAARIGLPLEKIISWPDRGDIQNKDGKITLTIPRQGYRMLLIGKAP